MRPRHPLQGLDARRTPAHDHARHADATAALVIAATTAAALWLLVALFVATRP